MKPVVCFGEALIDFLNTDKQQDGPLTLNSYRQYPGGAPANAAVAVAKLGGKAYFAGQVGTDSFGDFLEQALQAYQVDTRFLARHPSAKTALAFVTLDKDGDRSFAFYRDNSADLLFSSEQLCDSWIDDQPIFHFCSNTLTNSAISETTKAAISMAKSHSCLVSFDVNLRHNLWPSGKADIELVNQLVYRSDIIKFSREELDYLAQGNETQYIRHCLSQGVSVILVTDGEHPIDIYTANNEQRISAPSVNAVDTTAGGDAFSGALLFAISQLAQPEQAINSMASLAKLVQFAAHCGAHTVTLPGAFPALPQFIDVETFWPTELYQ